MARGSCRYVAKFIEVKGNVGQVARGVIDIQLTLRQKRIIDLVKEQGPITSEQIADNLSLTRATLRPDLAILTMVGILEAKPRVGYYYTNKPLPFFMGNEITELTVRDVMSRPVVVRDSVPLYDAIVTMMLEDAGTLTVVEEGGFLAGVVSRKDLLRISLGQVDIHKVPAGIVMTRLPNVVSTSPEESVYDAARKMVEHQVDGLPVVSPKSIPGGEPGGPKEGLEVVGRITKTNIAKLFVELGAGAY